MDWLDVVGKTSQIVSCAKEDLLAAEGTWKINQVVGSQVELERNVRKQNTARKKKLLQRLSELRTQKELLITAPEGTPGLQQALKNVENLIVEVVAQCKGQM